MNANNTSNDNTSFAETPTANTNRVPIKETKQNSLASSSSVAGGGSAANNVMKERKKSLMTRFIPGRGAGMHKHDMLCKFINHILQKGKEPVLLDLRKLEFPETCLQIGSPNPLLPF